MISSNCLFHFTPEFEYLISILEKGIRISYCKEDYSWLTVRKIDPWMFDEDVEDDELENKIEIGIPMACFCDTLPILSKGHMSLYGNYGIGFKKEHLTGLNPIIYLRESSNVTSIMQGLNIAINRIPHDSRHYVSKNQMDALLPYIKPYSECFKKGTYQSNNHLFYDENEWRFVSPWIIYPPLSITEYDKLDDDSRCVDHWSFEEENIEYLIVNNLKEKEELVTKYENLSDKVILKEEFEKLKV